MIFFFIFKPRKVHEQVTNRHTDALYPSLRGVGAGVGWRLRCRGQTPSSKVACSQPSANVRHFRYCETWEGFGLASPDLPTQDAFSREWNLLARYICLWLRRGVRVLTGGGGGGVGLENRETEKLKTERHVQTYFPPTASSHPPQPLNLCQLWREIRHQTVLLIKMYHSFSRGWTKNFFLFQHTGYIILTPSHYSPLSFTHTQPFQVFRTFCPPSPHLFLRQQIRLPASIGCTPLGRKRVHTLSLSWIALMNWLHS